MSEPTRPRRALSVNEVARILAIGRSQPQQETARQFGVRPGVVSRILTGKAWNAIDQDAQRYEPIRHTHVLTLNDAAAIRALDGTMSRRDIAARFGVSESTVSRIVNGRLWVTEDGVPPRKRSAKRLTPESVRAIRALAGTCSGRKLAARFGVAESTVRAVIARRTWREVT